MKTLILTFLLAPSPLVSLAQTDTTEWTVLLGGTKAGFTKQWRNSDGSFTEWYQYNDRGRGDSTVTTFRINKEGYLTFIDGKGVDYFKKPVYEKYTLENGIAHWENNSEKETKNVSGLSEYVTLKISVGSSLSNYFQSQNNTIQHLPTGSSTINVLKEHTITNGKTIRLISIFGLSSIPSYLWIDEKDEVFAYPGDWLASIRKGYEYLNSELLEIQNEYKEEYSTGIVKSLTSKIAGGLAITNATLFDSKTGKAINNSTILVGNGKILNVSTNRVKIPKDFKVIDGTGKFVMPGLWDMHVHYGDISAGLMNLACGVTNVRDMGSGETLLDKKKSIDNGSTLGPRIQVICGFIDRAGPYAGPIGAKINNLEEGIEAIKKYAGIGYQQIKLYSSIKPEWVKPLADEAKKLNLRVSGHIPAHMTAEEAVLSGYDEIQHTNMLFLNFYGKELDTRTPLRFSAVAMKAAFFDFESNEFKSFIKLLRERNITIDPTVSIFENMFQGKEGKTNLAFESVASRFPLTMQRNLKSNSGLQIPNGMEETYSKSFANILKMVKTLYDNGITIVPGTDGMPGFLFHRELENYSIAGIPNNEVLRMATIISATIAGKSNQYGSIEKDKAADLIIIDGDPLKRIQDIRRVEFVVKDENFYSAKDMLDKLAIKHFDN
jgi:imidazolonepropionase-like amidohydrolase